MRLPSTWKYSKGLAANERTSTFDSACELN
jgi:hypothetical protein